MAMKIITPKRRTAVTHCLALSAALLILFGVCYIVFAMIVGFYSADPLLASESTKLNSNREATRVTSNIKLVDTEQPQSLLGAITRNSTKLSSSPTLFHGPTDLIDSPPSASLYGNRRAVVPLLLTSTKYHGTSLFATTLQGWILKFLIPQGNIDVIVFYDVAKVNLSELLGILKLVKGPSHSGSNRSSGGRIPAELLVDVTLSPSDADLLGDGFFVSKYHSTFPIRVHPVRLPYPQYLTANMSLIDNPQWMRCGCPPVCPQKRATVDYVQGTRWYTYDLFLQPIVLPYSFWIKLDVDIWIFREIPLNLVETLIHSGAVFAHTGYIYNGNGCSLELHKAIREYLDRTQRVAKSDGQQWWLQDDNVYYSNFVISSMAFHLSREHMELAKALTEYPTGFFKYRWTDQSLFHKVFGVFYGPSEADFLLDWTHWRWSKKVFRKGAVFYHSKGKKTSSQLRRTTDL